MAKKKVPAKKKAKLPAKKKAKLSPRSTKTSTRSKKKTSVVKKAKRKTDSPEVEIRKLDAQIVKMVNRRATLSGRLLQSQPMGMATQDDEALWARLEHANGGPLPNRAMRAVFREILSAARQKVKTQRIAYLGPAFSFTHLAAIERFGRSADLMPVSTIASVFEEVNRGHADYGLVPIENSTDGRVVDTLDMFTRLPLRICGEVQINVHHNLLARSPRSEITEIYSKPQALSQCRDWLAKNMPHARLIEVTSTSTAAQLARDKPGAGAVASEQAAVEHALQIVASDIQDKRDNVTRFAVIGDESVPRTGKDRTALLLQIKHRSGSLADALVAFKNAKINLTWIESFPLRSPEVGYLFFLDFEGHVQDANVKRMIKQLESRAVRLETLGSYPRSEIRS